MKKKVLVVDDNNDNIYMLKSLLEGEGFAVTTAENGKAALESAHDDPPDIIVSDILMPVMDGYALCREWKSDDRLKHIPFVIYTATYTEPRDEQFALDLGADRFLIKPREPEVLVEELKKILEKVATESYIASDQTLVESDFIRRHYEAVIKKLEEKMAELEDVNARLVREIEEKENAKASLEKEKQALAKAEGKYRKIIENAIEGIFQTTPEGRCISVNPAFARMFGYASPEELMAKVTNFGTQLYVNRADRERLQAALDDTGCVTGFEAEMRRKDGATLWISINAHVEQDAADALLYIEGTTVDITERKQAEEQMKKKDEDVRDMTQQLMQSSKLATTGELAASIAHELNNPLAIVSLRIESLIGNLAEDNASQRELEIIEQEVGRMSNLVNNMLQFSRRSPPQISTVDVCEEIEKTLELMYYHLRKHNISIMRQFAPNIPQIHVDRQQLRQLFLNLFTNAVDAMPRGGMLTIAIAVLPEIRQIHIEVIDTGTGITIDVLSKIAEPFFTTKPEGKGTGLGLAICRRVVKAHKGTIEITSDAVPGKGTRVSVMLPVWDSSSVDYLCE